MKFVTKEQFDAAVGVLKTALQNGQVVFGRYDDENKEEMNTLLFCSEGGRAESEEADRITFVSPAEAAKNKLHSLRKRIVKARENVGQSNTILQNLESEEKKLADALSALIKPKE